MANGFNIYEQAKKLGEMESYQPTERPTACYPVVEDVHTLVNNPMQDFTDVYFQAA